MIGSDDRTEGLAPDIGIGSEGKFDDFFFHLSPKIAKN